MAQATPSAQKLCQQVGAQAPDMPWPHSTFEVAALCKPKDRTFELQKRGGPGHKRVFLFIPGLTGGEFCLKAYLMHVHPGKVLETREPLLHRFFTSQKDSQFKIPFYATLGTPSFILHLQTDMQPWPV